MKVKVAVASEGKMVAAHFGRCSDYTLFELDGDKIVDQKTISNPGHEPGFLPRYLAEFGVSVVIAGGMGNRARSLFESQNISTITGVTGTVENVIRDYISGSLVEGVNACNHGQHSGCDS